MGLKITGLNELRERLERLLSNDIGNPSRGDTENPSTPATVTPRLVPVRVPP